MNEIDTAEGARPHREIMVKVNAPVDEGIADLVAALSQRDGLQTLESCEGQKGRRDAYVYFRLGRWEEAGRFLFEEVLPRLDDDLRSGVALTLRAYDTDHAIAQISVEPEAVPALTKCIESL